MNLAGSRIGLPVVLFALLLSGCGSGGAAGSGVSGKGGTSGANGGGGGAGGDSGGDGGSGVGGTGGTSGANGGGGAGGSGVAGKGGASGANGGGGGGGAGGSGAGGRGGASGANGGGGGAVATFPCPKNASVAQQCKHGLEYCRLTTTGGTSCEPLPAACGTAPSCACIPGFLPPCDQCFQSAAGDIEFIPAMDCIQQ